MYVYICIYIYVYRCMYIYIHIIMCVDAYVGKLKDAQNTAWCPTRTLSSIVCTSNSGFRDVYPTEVHWLPRMTYS